MDNWCQKTEDMLIDQGYVPNQSEITERGNQNKVVRVRCQDTDLAVKWFTEVEGFNGANIGSQSNRFVGGWYVQTRLQDLLDIPIPTIHHAEFSEDRDFYIMENIEFVYADDLWSNDMYLMRVCQEMGSILSQVHSVSESSIGGIPGKKNDTMENMRRFIKRVENNVSNTPYMAYEQDLSSLTNRYEQIFNPRSTKKLIHGDTAASNILTNNDGVIVGLVDWEDSMYADPLLDIAIFQSMVCDIFGVFSPWETKTLRDSVVESYSGAVNAERLRILRALTHLWAGAKINSEAMLSPWNRVAGRSQMTRQEIHRNRFESIVDEMNN